MGRVERGVVKPPNKPTAGGDDRNNGFLPLGGGASTVHPANYGPGGDRKMGSFPLSGGAPAIQRNGYRFDVDDAPGTANPMPTAVEPGKGTVPVNPFLPGGAVARADSVPDEARPRSMRGNDGDADDRY
jgi:hypothetical protein